MKKTTETTLNKKLYNEIYDSLRIDGENSETLCQKFTHQEQPTKRQSAKEMVLSRKNGENE